MKTSTLTVGALVALPFAPQIGDLLSGNALDPNLVRIAIGGLWVLTLYEYMVTLFRLDERAKVVSACQAPHLPKIRHDHRTLGQARQDHYATHPRLTMVAEPYDIRRSKYLRLERVVNKPVNNFQHATRAQRYKLGPLQ